MGIPDSSLLDLIEKFRSWITWGHGDTRYASRGFGMTDSKCYICSNCELDIQNSCLEYLCQSCGRQLCWKCAHALPPLHAIAQSFSMETSEAVFNVKTCKLCFELGPLRDSASRCSSKINPSESPVSVIQEPPSPSFSGERFEGHSTNPQSPASIHHSPSRSDEDEEEGSRHHFCGPLSECSRDTSTVDSVCVSGRHDFYSFVSVGSSPAGSPSRISITSNGVRHYVQQEYVKIQGSQPICPNDQELSVLGKCINVAWDPKKAEVLSRIQTRVENLKQQFDSETLGLIWFPPPPESINDDLERSSFTYDDEDDDIGGSGVVFSPTSDLEGMCPAKEKKHVDQKEPLRAVIEDHFKSLVSQLLSSRGILATEDIVSENWLDIVTSIAWQAATFIKPDIRGGGSMDPCNYVKVKCVTSGSPSESKLIKGVVCTKNIKHKRMASQHKNPRLLVLGGALEFQRLPNQLASFETLLQQEKDHLKIILSKIEAHHPNILLVEKSVSSFAQEQLLAKDISLVLNVKRSLLERIARCTGAIITPSTDHISTTRSGRCELFHVEKILEDHEPANRLNKRPSKTLMFFEGCPRRLGCTVILSGSSHVVLKKVKEVVKYAVFATYHLSLETSFLANEGANLPNLGGSTDLNLELGLQESLSELGEFGYNDLCMPDDLGYRKALSKACHENLVLNLMLRDTRSSCPSIRMRTELESPSQVETQPCEPFERSTSEKTDAVENFAGYSALNEDSHSILVFFSSQNILNGTACERPKLLRVKFYGSSDKPLGKYLKDDLFDKSFRCQSCKESAEAHTTCFTHPHGNLTINVKHLLSGRLPGGQEGKIWMWHRCLRCLQHIGVLPTTRRVVMSDAAWGLSFGKFLELSFSNHATGNRIASCGHSLQKDCLKFYGCGSVVASFKYSSLNILSVSLPPSILEFNNPREQTWTEKEASMDLDHFADQRASVLGQSEVEVLDYNLSSHSLFTISDSWGQQIHLQDCLFSKGSSSRTSIDTQFRFGIGDSLMNSEEWDLNCSRDDNGLRCPQEELDQMHQDMDSVVNGAYIVECLSSSASILSDKIDSAWSGADQTAAASFFKWDLPSSSSPSSIPHVPYFAEGATLMVPKIVENDNLITVYDNEPTSLIYCALSSKEYTTGIMDKPNRAEGGSNASSIKKLNFITCDLSSWHCFGTLDLDYMHHINYGSGNALPVASSFVGDQNYPHLKITFRDQSPAASGKVEFSVTCYFAKHFDSLRRRCCPSEADFVRSLSQCRKWNARGGKSNAYFAKSFDERFIIKQMTKTEMESFEEFSPEYFKYLTEAFTSGSPTCLAKVLGIYQVILKHSKGGKEKKVDLMVMENLFFRRSISRIYDLKGSARSRYNSDTTGANKVLLDMNLLETLSMNPIFLASKAKRQPERGIWNDTSFLASIDVMDYSLLVGVDEERKELVVGIIDYMRQYTWDKQLETWVKATGILGGPKNASPTIVSPKLYKKRFRKAMTNYFLTVPDQWSS